MKEHSRSLEKHSAPDCVYPSLLSCCSVLFSRVLSIIARVSFCQIEQPELSIIIKKVKQVRSTSSRISVIHKKFLGKDHDLKPRLYTQIHSLICKNV